MNEGLAALARKYRTMADLRRHKLRTGEHTPREALRSLAREFPGALRELDVLPLDEVDRRAAALEAVASGSSPAPWMGWMARHHSLLRAALRIKAHARHGPLAAEKATQLAAEEGVDEVFALRCARPPSGRLGALVMERLAAETGQTLETLTSTLMPQRPSIEEVAAERERHGRT